MLSQDDYWARLALEAEEMKQEEPTFKPVGGNVTLWRGFIIGTGFYEGGVFIYELEITRDYPFKPPIVRNLTEIWHPNFWKERICVGILGKDWSPANNMVNIVETLRFLLSNPNPDDPLHLTCSKQMKNDLDGFATKARQFVELHAGWDQITRFGL